MSQPDESATPAAPRKRLGLYGRVLVGLLLGVFLGLFFGELLDWMRLVGDVYVGLLQITVMPYIVVSLIAGLGHLSWAQGRRLLLRAGLVMVGLWVIGLLVVALLPLALPNFESGSFFSTSSLETPPDTDFIDLFVPVNIFGSLARNVVPAVVVFCVAFGVALIDLRGRESMLTLLDTISAALGRINGWIVALTPYGVFAIATGTAATMTIDEFDRLQGFLILYTLAALYLTFVCIPLLVSALTPFTYREILTTSRGALLTAFATGKVIVVLPLLLEATKELFASSTKEQSEEVGPAVDALVPLVYPFPSLGKLLTLLFIPFTAWFVGEPMSALDYPTFLGAGLFASFGGPIIAIPFLLEMERLPSDMFQLFLAAGVWTERFGDMLASIQILAVTVLATCSLQGTLRVDKRALLRLLVWSALAFGVGVPMVRGYLASRFEMSFERDRILDQMTLVVDEDGMRAESTIYAADVPNPHPPAPEVSTLDRIRARKVIRVGFVEDNLPWTYRASDGRLLGFDIDMAHRLAIDLDVGLEFVPVTRDGIESALKEGLIDLAMSGIKGSIQRAERLGLSSPYIDVHLALIVPDFRARALSTYAGLRAQERLFIGLADENEFARLLPRRFPNVTVVKIDNKIDFFENRLPDVDALLTGAENGAAWTLRYPRFRVVRPTRHQVTLPLVYLHAGTDEAFDEFLEHWVDVKRRDGTVEDFYDYWILGRGAQTTGPRWSIIRDVLGWVD